MTTLTIDELAKAICDNHKMFITSARFTSAMDKAMAIWPLIEPSLAASPEDDAVALAAYAIMHADSNQYVFDHYYKLAKAALSTRPTDLSDAYEGAREDLLDWKRRALLAESELRRLGYVGVTANQPPQPAAYDRELIARMLDEYRVCTHCKYTAPAIEDQIRLVRAAENADAPGVHTASKPAGAVPLPERFCYVPNRPGEMTPSPSGIWVLFDSVIRYGDAREAAAFHVSEAQTETDGNLIAALTTRNQELEREIASASQQMTTQGEAPSPDYQRGWADGMEDATKILTAEGAGREAVAWVAPYVLEAYLEDGGKGRLVAGPNTGDRTLPIYTHPSPVAETETLAFSAKEVEWLEYAADHMADDSEPEDKQCELVLRGLLARRLTGSKTDA